MKRTIAFHIGGAALLVVASLVILVLLAPGRADADVTSDFLYDLACDSLADWTEVSSGINLAERIEIKIASHGTPLFYNQDFANLDTGNAFLVEAVVSIDLPPFPVAGQSVSGAKLAIDFRDSGMPDELYRIEVRFIIDSFGSKRIALYDVADGAADELAYLVRDFSVSYPERYRVRVRLQQISGTHYIFLESEPESTAYWENRDDTTNDPPNRAVVPLSDFMTEEVRDPGTVRFGNFSQGTYDSYWEKVHLTFSDDQTTLLPDSSTFDSDTDGIEDMCDNDNLDDDNDGVADANNDRCPDTIEGDVVDSNGCSIDQLDLLCHPNKNWKNHGTYVGCVTHISKRWVDEGVITEKEKGAIVSAAAKSGVGKKAK